MIFHFLFEILLVFLGTLPILFFDDFLEILYFFFEFVALFQLGFKVMDFFLQFGDFAFLSGIILFWLFGRGCLLLKFFDFLFLLLLLLLGILVEFFRFF